MKTNNLFKKYLIAWAVLVVLFNVIVFAVPNEIAGVSKFDGAFWSGYALIMLTLIGQIVCANLAMKADSAEKFFLNLPLITLSYTTLILSIIAGAACMAIPNVPNWALSCVRCFWDLRQLQSSRQAQQRISYRKPESVSRNRPYSLSFSRQTPKTCLQKRRQTKQKLPQRKYTKQSGTPTRCRWKPLQGWNPR